MPERLSRTAARVGAYLWAAPNSALGAVAGAIMVCLGGRVRFVFGAAEFHGGLVGALLAALPPSYRFGAATLGHVILAADQAALEALREHEHIHVGQYERWGPIFLPAYALSSLWQLLQGGCPYRDNVFERRARTACRPSDERTVVISEAGKRPRNT